MSTTTPQPSRAIITDALRKIDDLTARLHIAEQAGTEPIAVVGMGCRFPGGVNNPDQYWDLLKEGRSGIVAVPPQRWDAELFYTDDHTVPGTICNREGGFLTGWQPDEFDAEYFGDLTARGRRHRPAAAAVARGRLGGVGGCRHPGACHRWHPDGVVVGLSTFDYLLNLAAQVAAEDLDAYLLTGNTATSPPGGWRICWAPAARQWPSTRPARRR